MLAPAPSACMASILLGNSFVSDTLHIQSSTLEKMLVEGVCVMKLYLNYHVYIAVIILQQILKVCTVIQVVCSISVIPMTMTLCAGAVLEQKRCFMATPH